PNMTTCIKGEPFKMPGGVIYNPGKMPGGVIYNPGGVPKGTSSPRDGAPAQPRAARPPAVQPRSLISVDAVALHDWRFSHLSPAMLVNINIKSLLQSPIWKKLVSAWTGG